MKRHLKLALLSISGGLVITVISIFVGGKSFSAKARPRPTQCYWIPTDTPIASADARERKEVWCYRELEEPIGARIVYNIDRQGNTRPELAVMIEADGTLRHASLVKGKITIHRLRAEDFNPIGAPLVPPANAEPVRGPIAPSQTIDEGIKIFQEFGNVPVHAAHVKSGEYQASIPEDNMPWRGYWFPRSSAKMHLGENSPMAKYDRFVARRVAGTSPGSQAFEKRLHGSKGIHWEGHCNGWAAASTMYKEPKKPVTDPITGIMFSIQDLKGLLTERSYCPRLVTYGRRFADRPTDNAGDIYAGTFHNVITYFIGQLKKPVNLDLDPKVPVQNAVASAYKMTVTRTGPNSFYVRNLVKIHKYDEKQVDEPGEAPSHWHAYAYTLTTDRGGFARSGGWSSDNPDFLWVPLSPADCAEKNKFTEEFWIDEIFRRAQ